MPFPLLFAAAAAAVDIEVPAIVKELAQAGLEAYDAGGDRVGVYLNSTAIEHVEYSPKSSEMTIGFKASGDYDYSSVPPDIFQGLITSSSPGTYYNESIKEQFGGPRSLHLGNIAKKAAKFPTLRRR